MEDTLTLLARKNFLKSQKSPIMGFFFPERPQTDFSCNFLRSQTPAPLFSFSRIASEFQAITGRKKKTQTKEKVLVVHHLKKRCRK